MEDDTILVTREQYVEMLIDGSFRQVSEIELGFVDWCVKRVSVWREEGHDETWIRQHIEVALTTRGFYRNLKEQGLTMLEIREEFRKLYAAHPELYDIALEQERLHPGPLRYRGNTSDLRQRYTLRVMVYETDKLAYEKFCAWSRQPAPDPNSIFFEQPDNIRVVRDLSTVEELEIALAMTRYALQLFEEAENLTQDQVSQRLKACGKQLRTTFITKYGYLPEDSATPYVPVTIDGPQDHDVYYAKEYP